MRELRMMRRWRDLDAFLPPLKAATRGNDEVADLVEEVILDYLRDAIIEFCEDTKVIRQPMDIQIECGVCEYPLVLNTCEQIIGVGEVGYGDDCQYDCAGSKSWNWGDVVFRLSEDDDVLLINRAPEDEGRILQLDLHVAPTRDACKVDEILFQRYRTPILNLTLERIHLMVNVPWSSTTRAQYYRQLYAKREIEVNERRMDRGMETRTLIPTYKMGRAKRRF